MFTMQNAKKWILTALAILMVFVNVFAAGVFSEPALAEEGVVQDENNGQDGENGDDEGGHSGTSNFNEADGNKIESVHLVWNTPDTRDNGDADFLWLSTSSTTPLSMKFTVQVNLSGQADAGDYAPGALRISIPRQIWHKRDLEGEPGSTLEELYGKMDLPITIKPIPSVDWYYEVDGDNYVFINNKRIGATSNHSFECTIYDIAPLMIVDESISEQLMAHVDALTSEGNTIWMDSNILQAQIDTSERITGAYKSAKLYEYIDDDDGVPESVLAYLPSGTPEDYVYVKWTTYSSMSGNQYFSLAMDDPETWCYDRVLNQETNQDEYIPVCQGIFLAQTSGRNVLTGLGDEPVEGKGEIYNDGKSFRHNSVVTNYYGSRSPEIVLWAAYPNETFEDGHTYFFRNRDTWDLLEYDPEVEYWEDTDEQVLTTSAANGSVNFLRMKWIYPPGRFLAFKYIETNMTHTHPYYDSSNGSHQKQYTYEMALNKLREGKDVVMDYELLTVGYGYMFTAGPLANEVSWIDVNGVEHTSPIENGYDDNWNSEEWIQDPDHFLNWYYVMDTSDRWDFFNYVNRAGGDPQLTGEDYQFDGVYIQAPEIFNYDRQKNSAYRFREDTPFGYYPDNDPAKKPAVQVWVEYDNGATIDRESPTGKPEGWVYLGEYEVTSGATWVPFDNTTENGIVTGFRTRVTTNEAACKLTVYPRITLKASDRVRAIVEQLFAESGTPSTTFRNDDNLYIELFKTAEDQSIYDPETNPEGKVHPNQQMFLDEDVYYRQDIWDDSAIAKFTGAGYGITLSKSVRFDERSIEAGGDNDIINKRAILHYTATCTQESNLTSVALYNEAVESGAIKQDYSCIWYDLLPENVQPMTETVRMLRPGDKVLRVSTIPNYKDTGRIMMIVECELTPSPGRLSPSTTVGDRIQLAFDAYITWLDLNSMPDNYQFVNYVAYESGIEGQVGTIKGKMGEKDSILPAPRLNNSTPSNVPDDIAAAFTDLNANTDDGRFVYARAPITPRVNMDAHTEYVKFVSSDLEGIWTQGLDGQTQVNVYEGHNYTYRLTVSSAKGTNTWDMVFYDSIENYLIPRPDENDPMHDATKAEDYYDTREKANWQGDWQEGVGGAPGGQWRGRLYQVDLSGLYAMDCKPVLYYCTIPWMQFSDTYGEQVNEDVIFNDADGHYMLEDINTWTPVDMSTLVDGKWNVPDGLEVTGIAVDAKKTTNGENFVLHSKESVSIYLHMTAPNDHGDEGQWHAKGAYAHYTDEATGFEDINWEAATDPVNNMHAFNNTRLISRQANEDDSTMHAFLTMIRNDYTRVGIMPTVKLVQKVWDDDDNHDNLRPDSITVEMLRKVQFAPGDYEPVIDEETGEPITLEIRPVTVTETVDGVETEKEIWQGVFYQVPVVDDQGNKYLYQFRDTVTGYTCTSAEDANGRIILTNTHENETIPLKGEKQWMMHDGAELSDDAQAIVPTSIKVHLYRTGASGEEEFVTTLTVRPDANGKWVYDFGQQEKYERGGFEYVYSIKEEPVDGFVSSLADPAVLPEGYEIPFLSTDAYNPNELETFYNFYIPYGDLAVQKNILQATDVSKLHSFNFTLQLYETGNQENLVDGEFDYAVYDVETDAETGEETLVKPAVSTGKISAGGTFTIKGNQRIVIKKLPVGASYEITEAEKDGWNVASEPGQEAAPEMENAKGPVNTGVVTRANFTNTYSATGYAQVLARKTLTGRELKASMFTFELVDMNEGSETYGEVIRTAYNQAPSETTQDEATGVITSVADVKFGALVYEQGDAGKTFYYQVREKNTGKPGFTYSETVHDVQVEVSDNGNGTLTTVVTPGEAVQVPFDNTYEAEGELTLRGWKQLQKREAEDQEFEFELWASNENGEKLGSAPLQTVKNDADSNIVFAPIPFDQDMVSVDPENPFQYYYLVVEKDLGDETIIYTGYQHLYIITPKDNGNGVISFDQADKGYDADGNETDGAVPVFVNDVEDGHLKVTKNIVNGNPTTKFTFKVKLVGVEGGSFDLERGDGGDTGNGEDAEEEEEEETTASGIKPVYYADNALINGRTAYAALNKETGELIFFRTDPNNPMDPWGNTFTSTGFTSNRKLSADSKIVWFSNVESGNHPWTTNSSDYLAIKTVSMRDPLRPTNLTYFFQNCTNLVSVNLDKMDLHEASGTTRTGSWLYGTFSGTPNIKEIDLGTVDLSRTRDVQYAFRNCYSLETLNIGHLVRVENATYSTNYQDNAFTNTKITRITIGNQTTFSTSLSVDTYHHYPTPPSGYADVWVNVDTDEQLNSRQLFTEGGHGGTWELDPKYYNIVFDANGGAGSMSGKRVNVHRDFKTGYKFFNYGYDFAGFRDNYGTFFPVDEAGKVTIPSNQYSSYITSGEELEVVLKAEWTEVDNTTTTTGDTLTFTMYAGESVTIKNLPAYTAYEVWELLPEGWVQVSKTNASGIIQPFETAESTFTNEYAPEKATIGLNAYKLMDGDPAGGFTFALYESDNNWQPVGDPIDTKVSSAGGMASFDMITYGPEDAGEHRYVIKEVVENPDENILYDTDYEHVTVLVTDDGEGNMSAIAGYHVDGGIFRNDTKRGSLKITKYGEGMTYQASQQEFTFKVSFFNAQGNPAVLKYGSEKLTSLSGKVSNLNSSSVSYVTCPLTDNVIEVSIKGDQSVLFEDVLPAGVTYVVEEMPTPKGWTQTAAEGTTGTIVGGEVSQASFTNTYEAKGEVTLMVEKAFPDEVPESGAYTFELYPYMINGQDVGVWDFENMKPFDGQQPLQTATNSTVDEREYVEWLKGDPQSYVNPEYMASLAEFEPIEITYETSNSNPNIYAIREVAGDDASVEYTTDVLFAQVFMTDIIGDGTLYPSVMYFRQSAAGQTPQMVGYHGYALRDGDSMMPVIYASSLVYYQQALAYTNPVYIDAFPGDPMGSRAFINERTDGALQITKTVTGATDAANGTVFTVQVTLKDKNGQPLADNFYPTTVDGEPIADMQTDPNGVGEVTLEEGQVVEILCLPHGATYEVTETDLPGGFELDHVDGEEGTIVGGAVQEATVHNKYDAQGQLNFVAQKVMSPAEELTLDAGRFSFEIKDDRGSVIRTAVNDADGNVTFEPINYTMRDLDQTYVYTITEALGDNLIEEGEESIYATDRTVYNMEVTITDNGDGTLEVTPVVTLNEEEVETALFSNTEKTKVYVTKKWAGDEEAAGKRPAYIILNLYANGEHIVSRAVNAERNGTSDANVWEYTFDNLAKYKDNEEIEYTVTEDPVDFYYPTVEGLGNTYTIVNTYSEDDVVLEGEKTLTDHLTGEAAEMTDGQFQVKITGKEGNEPLPEVTVADVMADGTFAFDTIVYTLDDLGVNSDGYYNLENTYTYLISEVIPEGVTEDLILPETHVRYDDTVYEVQVKLSYDPEAGVLTAAASEENVDVIFANESNADVVKLSLTAQKQLERWALKGDDFTFLLKREGTVVVEAVSNDADGLITFPEQTFSGLDLEGAEVVDGKRTKEITFTMEENVGIRNGIIYDADVETVVVTVTENEDGSITAAADRTGEDQPIFQNTIETTQLQVTKEWQGGEGGLITLTLYANGEKMDPQPAYTEENGVYTYTGLPKYTEDGKAVVYAAKEKYVDGFMTIYQNVAPYAQETDMIYNGGTIVNRAVTTFHVQKVWEGLAEGEEAPQITLTLYCNGEPMDKKTPTPDADGWYVFNNLPITYKGETAVYTVVEEPLEGYTVSYGEVEEGEEEPTFAEDYGTIVNRKIPKTGDESRIGLWAACVAVGFSGLACVVYFIRKQRKGEA